MLVQYGRHLYNNLTGISITLQDIIIGDDFTESYNIVVTLVAFLIYKKWLVESMNNVLCINNISIHMLKPDLKSKANIYENLRWKDIICN